MDLLGYFGALCIGLILGLTGGGGSVLTVPILVYLFHLNPTIATGYSLFIVGTTSIFGATQNYFKNLVDIQKGFLFAIPSFIGVYLTRRYIIPILPQEITFANISLTKGTFLMLLFALVMFFAGVSMLKKRKKKQPEEVVINTYLLLFQTFLIGILIGLIGAGGGFLIIPSLVLFAHLPMKKAIGTSLFIIAMNSLIGFIGDIQNLNIDWTFLLRFTSLSIIGIFIGGFLGKFLNNTQLKKGFGYFVIIMSIVIFINELK